MRQQISPLIDNKLVRPVIDALIYNYYLELEFNAKRIRGIPPFRLLSRKCIQILERRKTFRQIGGIDLYRTIVQSLRVALVEEAGGYRHDSRESCLTSFPYIYIYMLFSTVNAFCKLYFTNFIRLIDSRDEINLKIFV